MAIVKYGEWEIDVDLEKTAQYYSNVAITNNDQTYRNYKKYCESLPQKEREFFDSFAADPLKFNIDIGGMSKKHLMCSGYFYVYGKYIKTPKEIIWTVEQLAQNNFVDDRPDPRIYIGIFKIDFQNPENLFCSIPHDMPEGCICINFSCDGMPWLLDEKCELQSFDPPRFMKIRYIMSRWKSHKKYKKEVGASIVSLFSDVGINFEIMNEKETLKFKKQWLSAFAPQNVNIRELNELCVNSRKHHAYLWHLFSFEHIKASCAEQASMLFDKKTKDTAVLIENIENLGYRIKNLSKLNSDFLNELLDVTVTASDFSWTYCKTHEIDIGPYYYEPYRK